MSQSMCSFLVCQLEHVEWSLENSRLLSIAHGAPPGSAAAWLPGCAPFSLLLPNWASRGAKVPQCSKPSVPLFTLMPLPGGCAPPPSVPGHHPLLLPESAKHPSGCRASLPLLVAMPVSSTELQTGDRALSASRCYPQRWCSASLGRCLTRSGWQSTLSLQVSMWGWHVHTYLAQLLRDFLGNWNRGSRIIIWEVSTGLGVTGKNAFQYLQDAWKRAPL